MSEFTDDVILVGADDLTTDNEESIVDILQPAGTELTCEEYTEFAVALAMCRHEGDQDEWGAMERAGNTWNLCAASDTDLISSFSACWPSTRSQTRG